MQVSRGELFIHKKRVYILFTKNYDRIVGSYMALGGYTGVNAVILCCYFEHC